MLRNIDHLLDPVLPAPAFVFHGNDYGLNSGVMLLEPSAITGGRDRMLKVLGIHIHTADKQAVTRRVDGILQRQDTSTSCRSNTTFACSTT